METDKLFLVNTRIVDSYKITGEEDLAEAKEEPFKYQTEASSNNTKYELLNSEQVARLELKPSEAQS
jgi:hypothetical protein